MLSIIYYGRTILNVTVKCGECFPPSLITVLQQYTIFSHGHCFTLNLVPHM
jgi:hypothetical protein